MTKIQDRITLGIIAGIIGNIFKQIVSQILEALNYQKVDAPKKAAALYVTRKKTKKPLGLLLGLIADFSIACKLGIILVYVISATGKDNHLIKGLSLGSFAWTIMYGLLSRMGGTGFWVLRPRDGISGYITHIVFGLATAEAIVRLGDESLFTPRYQALSNSKNAKEINQETYVNQQNYEEELTY